MLSEKEKIDLISNISLDINEVKDLDILLERILRGVRRFFNADAGSIYLRDGDRLQFKYTQNDTLQERLGPGRKLLYETFSIPMDDRSIAGHVANSRETVNISDAYRMRGTEPYVFDSEFDELAQYRTQSILAVPMINQRGRVLGVVQIINARDAQGCITAFARSDEALIRPFATSAGLALERAQLTRNIIMRMLRMAELRDPGETGPHVNRVAAYAVEIYDAWARKKGASFKQVERKKDALRMAAMLHDVGKVAIRDEILGKKGRLSEEEFEVMKSHTYLGARLFKDAQSEFDVLAAEVALTHHERWDGTGYPGHVDPETGKALPEFRGAGGRALPKTGQEIPLFGRIVAVADVYDALSSRRVYKEPWDEERVVASLKRGAGSYFDPEVIEAFFSRLDVMHAVTREYPERANNVTQCQQ